MRWPGLWPGVEQHLDVEARETQRLAARERVLGYVALERAEPRRCAERDVLEHRALDLGAVHRRAGRPCERGDRADVVEVAVGDEDRLDLYAELLDCAQQPLGLVAGIDEHGP